MADNANSQRHGTDVWTSKRGWAPIMPDESTWAEWRIKDDNRQIELLARGLLRIHDQRPDRGTIPPHVWARSRTSVSIEEQEIFPGGPSGHELVGGFVTYEEALLEFPQPDNSKPVPVYPISAMPIRQLSETEALASRHVEHNEQFELHEHFE